MADDYNNLDWNNFNPGADISTPYQSQDFSNPSPFQFNNYGNNLRPVGDYQPQGGEQSFGTEANQSFAPRETPGFFDNLQSGLSRMNFDPSNREGMANVMRGGQAGVGLLGTYLQMQENKKARQAQENALQFMKSQMNPQVDEWGNTIKGMMNNPSGYLGDPVDQANSQGATDAAMRTANRQGRSGLNRDEMLGIQNVRQKSYQDRMRQLIDLYGKGITNNQAAASAMGNIMSRAPQGDTKAMMSGIGGLFEAGRDINNGGNSMTQQQWDERRKASFNLLGN
jgi:hypothetical protein